MEIFEFKLANQGRIFWISISVHNFILLKKYELVKKVEFIYLLSHTV